MSALAVSLTRDVHASAPAEISSAELAAQHQADDDRKLADMDSFADWLAGECGVSNAVFSDWIVTWPARRAEKLAQANVGEVLHLVVHGDADDAIAARDELRRRYLEAMV